MEIQPNKKEIFKTSKMKTNTIILGDALMKLKELPGKSINMCMTSPPYWALRDYGIEGQLGLESTFNDYITKLCDIFDEVKRVLRDDGTIWINLGDTYARGGNPDERFDRKSYGGKATQHDTTKLGRGITKELPSKCLIMIPFRFAIEMVNRGWILRNTIIWYKPNCMPSSVKDRFTVYFEYLFFLSKKKKYYFETQYEPTITRDKIVRDRDKTKLNKTPGRSRMAGLRTNDYEMKNKRTVWTINPKPFKEAHFAVYPEKLCEIPIKAGCPKEGIVLDPFFGSGTTGLVALKQNKKFIGIELNKEYIEIAKKRLKSHLEQTKL